jgi:shikimate dehydrogenase
MSKATFLKLAVIGDPVEHSASPRLQRAFLEAAGLEGSYEALRVVAGDAARAIDSLRAEGYAGLNVTTPLKAEAFARAEWRDPVAAAAGAVNTLVLGERVDGYNTDGIGALGALADAGVPEPAGNRILVLGAGPTARAAVAALVAADAVVFVWNRTVERALALARDLGARPFEPGMSARAVLATLAPGADLRDEAVLRAVLDAPVLIDANYAGRATLGRTLGRAAVDGLGMLEHSARASFELWRARFAGLEPKPHF